MFFSSFNIQSLSLVRGQIPDRIPHHFLIDLNVKLSTELEPKSIPLQLTCEKSGAIAGYGASYRINELSFNIDIISKTNTLSRDYFRNQLPFLSTGPLSRSTQVAYGSNQWLHPTFKPQSFDQKFALQS